MSKITSEQVKELRELTSVSVMQCRKALEEADGDMEKALIILRKKGSEIAEKKSDRSAADGLVVIKNDGHKALALILNCETDFVARNADFINLANSLTQNAWQNGVDAARGEASNLINDVVLKVGENIQIGLMEEIQGETVGSYTHHTGKIGAVVVLKGGNQQVANDIAMHTVAMKPKYLNQEEISDDDKNNVMEALKKEVEETNKTQEMKQKIMEGKISSYFKEQTLNDQSFFKLPEKTIAQYAKENGAEIEKFLIYNI